MKSLPSSTCLFPNRLFVGINEEADGGPAKKKLKIGSKTMNALITMSSLIKENKVFVGPEWRLSTGFYDCTIFYETTKQKQFVAAVKNIFESTQEMYKVPKSMSSLRQLSSGFGKACTFAAWRATLDCLDADLLQPTTIFTIADIPSNKGYGISDTSIAKAVGNILQCVVTAVMLGRSLSNEEIKNIIDQFTPKIQQNPTFLAFLTHLKTRETKDPLDIATSILSISKHAAGSLSTANKKISKNVEVKLMEQFGLDVQR